MSKQLLLVVKAVSAEKDVAEDVVFKALEHALVTATKKRCEDDLDVRIAIDRDTGEYSTFRRWTVMELPEAGELEFPDQEFSLEQAKEKSPELEIGDVYEEPMKSLVFGRIMAQTAKQVIFQEIRKAERERVAQSYEDRMGQIISGVVKKTTRDSIILDLGENAEAVLKREYMIPRENMRTGDRIRVYLFSVKSASRGPQLLVSRTHKEMLMELFKIEVPEIGEEVIQVKAAARDPGARAKIAVKTNDGRIDPIGACIGMRGARVQAVSNELNGERVDIILWDDNPAQLVISALAPAEVASIVVDEDSNTMDIAVAEEQLAQAIGKGGQNIRLASELSGWTLNIMTEADFAAKAETESQDVLQTLQETLEIDEDVAALLVEEGFASVEDIAYVSEEELLAIEEFDEDIVEELRNRANDYLLTQALVDDDAQQPADDLLALEGMLPELAKMLAKNEIVTQEDLAECAVDELLEIEGLDIDAKLAADLIMLARAPWFETNS